MDRPENLEIAPPPRGVPLLAKLAVLLGDERTRWAFFFFGVGMVPVLLTVEKKRNRIPKKTGTKHPVLVELSGQESA
jgi:hypothetical protein